MRERERGRPRVRSNDERHGRVQVVDQGHGQQGDVDVLPPERRGTIKASSRVRLRLRLRPEQAASKSSKQANTTEPASNNKPKTGRPGRYRNQEPAPQTNEDNQTACSSMRVCMCLSSRDAYLKGYMRQSSVSAAVDRALSCDDSSSTRRSVNRHYQQKKAKTRGTEQKEAVRHTRKQRKTQEHKTYHASRQASSEDKQHTCEIQ